MPTKNSDIDVNKFNELIKTFSQLVEAHPLPYVNSLFLIHSTQSNLSEIIRLKYGININYALLLLSVISGSIPRLRTTVMPIANKAMNEANRIVGSSPLAIKIPNEIRNNSLNSFHRLAGEFLATFYFWLLSSTVSHSAFSATNNLLAQMDAITPEIVTYGFNHYLVSGPIFTTICRLITEVLINYKTGQITLQFLPEFIEISKTLSNKISSHLETTDPSKIIDVTANPKKYSYLVHKIGFATLSLFYLSRLSPISFYDCVSFTKYLILFTPDLYRALPNIIINANIDSGLRASTRIMEQIKKVISHPLFRIDYTVEQKEGSLGVIVSTALGLMLTTTLNSLFDYNENDSGRLEKLIKTVASIGIAITLSQATKLLIPTLQKKSHIVKKEAKEKILKLEVRVNNLFDFSREYAYKLLSLRWPEENVYLGDLYYQQKRYIEALNAYQNVPKSINFPLSIGKENVIIINTYEEFIENLNQGKFSDSDMKLLPVDLKIFHRAQIGIERSKYMYAENNYHQCKTVDESKKLEIIILELTKKSSIQFQSKLLLAEFYLWNTHLVNIEKAVEILEPLKKRIEKELEILTENNQKNDKLDTQINHLEKKLQRVDEALYEAGKVAIAYLRDNISAKEYQKAKIHLSIAKKSFNFLIIDKRDRYFYLNSVGKLASLVFWEATISSTDNLIQNFEKASNEFDILISSLSNEMGSYEMEEDKAHVANEINRIIKAQRKLAMYIGTDFKYYEKSVDALLWLSRQLVNHLKNSIEKNSYADYSISLILEIQKTIDQVDDILENQPEIFNEKISNNTLLILNDIKKYLGEILSKKIKSKTSEPIEKIAKLLVQIIEEIDCLKIKTARYHIIQSNQCLETQSTESDNSFHEHDEAAEQLLNQLLCLSPNTQTREFSLSFFQEYYSENIQNINSIYEKALDCKKSGNHLKAYQLFTSFINKAERTDEKFFKANYHCYDILKTISKIDKTLIGAEQLVLLKRSQGYLKTASQAPETVKSNSQENAKSLCDFAQENLKIILNDIKQLQIGDEEINNNLLSAFSFAK